MVSIRHMMKLSYLESIYHQESDQNLMHNTVLICSAPFFLIHISLLSIELYHASVVRTHVLKHNVTINCESS